MARTALCLPLAILFLASVIPSEAQKSEAAPEERVTVAAGAPLTVECRLRPEQRVEWRRDGAEPPHDLRASEEAPDARVAARLRAPAARPHHAGLYTCSRDGEHRVRVVVLPAAAAGSTEAAAPAPPAPAPAGALPEVVYDVRTNISLHCSLPPDSGLPYVWSKNGTELEQVWELKERYVLERGGAALHVARALEDDFGNYSCAVGPRALAWAVRGRPHLKLPANTNVVEGQKLKLVCKAVGKPYVRVAWGRAAAPDDNCTELGAELARRVTLAASEQGVPDAVLLLDAAERADAGRYCCRAEGARAETVLRVKDMYAALWPFLGICAEVFVLCAIILVYEKRRTKPELDDSDTDNHDQKKS